MTIVISGVDRRTKLDKYIILDVLLTEEIDFQSEVTMFPVEDGTNITDHITQGNERIRLAGFISTADVSGGNSIASSFGYGVDNAPKLIDIVEAGRELHKSRALLNVSTGQLLYPGYATASLNLSRSADSDGGNWLSVKIELVKINKVTLKKADVPPPETAAPSVAGRAGETNKPAGRSTPAGTTTNNSASGYGPQQNPNDSTGAMKLRNSVRAADPASTTGAIRDTLTGFFR